MSKRNGNIRVPRDLIVRTILSSKSYAEAARKLGLTRQWVGIVGRSLGLKKYFAEPRKKT